MRAVIHLREVLHLRGKCCKVKGQEYTQCVSFNVNKAATIVNNDSDMNNIQV